MDYEVREPPKDEPITLEEAKLHLRCLLYTSRRR